MLEPLEPANEPPFQKLNARIRSGQPVEISEALGILTDSMASGQALDYSSSFDFTRAALPGYPPSDISAFVDCALECMEKLVRTGSYERALGYHSLIVAARDFCASNGSGHAEGPDWEDVVKRQMRMAGQLEGVAAQSPAGDPAQIALRVLNASIGWLSFPLHAEPQRDLELASLPKTDWIIRLNRRAIEAAPDIDVVSLVQRLPSEIPDDDTLARKAGDARSDLHALTEGVRDSIVAICMESGLMDEVSGIGEARPDGTFRITCTPRVRMALCGFWMIEKVEPADPIGS